MRQTWKALFMITQEVILVEIPGICRDPKWAFANLTPMSTQYLTHSYHRYPAKFIPQLASALIKEYSKLGDVVCDPFGGCGTTLVEAKLAGRQSIGFDLNPLATLITRAKIVAIPPDKLRSRYTLLCGDIEAGLGTQEQTIPSDSLNYDRLLYWFGKTNLEQLILLRDRIWSEANMDIRRFFLCGLSHILKKCSYWLGSSIKPQKDYTKVPEPPTEVFRRHASRMVIKNEEYYQVLQRERFLSIKSIVGRADARHLPLRDESVDLIVTSPPYGVSYDYPSIHQLSLYLYGYSTLLPSSKALFIGSVSNRGNRYHACLVSNEKTREIVNALAPLDRKLSQAIGDYFTHMRLAYREFYRVLRKGRRACIVLGDTVLRGIHIPTVEIALEQLEGTSFNTEQIIERPISRKVIAPYRDRITGKFTSMSNPNARKVYSHECIIVVKKK